MKEKLGKQFQQSANNQVNQEYSVDDDNAEFQSCIDRSDFFNDQSHNMQKKSFQESGNSLMKQLQSGYSQSAMREDQSKESEIISRQQVPTKNQSTAEGWKSVQGTVSFDHVLSDIGIGKYQYLFYGVMATLGLTEGAQVSVFTIMIPLLKKEWDVGEDTNSLQVCLVFLGFLVGSMMSGQFADRYGRRKPFIYSSFFTVFLTLFQALSQNITQMIILRFLCAILVGFFGPLGVTLLAEITPLAVRGRFMSLLTVSFSLGQLYGQFVGYFTLDGLDRGDWRTLIIWTGLPGFLAWYVAICYMDESVRFDIIDGKYEEGFKIMNKMNKMNGNKLGMEEMSEEIKGHLINWSKEVNKSLHQKKGNIEALFRKEGRKLTPLIWFNWFSLSFIYYGILVLMPKMMDELQESKNPHKEKDESNEIVKLAISTFSEMIAAAIASFLIEIKGLGRKNSMIICFTLQGLSSYMVFNDKGEHFVLWASICKFFLTMTFIFAYQFTAEVYSTKIRTTGIGMANGIGRSGGALVPWVSEYLQAIDMFAPFLLFSCLSFITALIDFIIPYDTLGRELDIPEDEDEHQQNIIKEGNLKQELQSFSQQK